MNKNAIIAKLHKRFPSLPQNALLTFYKAQLKCLRLLMMNNIPIEIRRLTKEKVSLASELPLNLLPTCLVAGKKTIQENEVLDSFMFLVISVP